MRKLSLIVSALILLVGCASTLPPPPPPVVEVVVPKEVTWSGVVKIEETLTFPRGTELTILPGTMILIAPTDEDDDGLGDVAIILEEGTVNALGTLEEPIVFTSLDTVATPGSWGELRFDFSTTNFRYVVLEGSTKGLHFHFSKGLVEDSIIRNNIDGTRLGESKMEFRRVLFLGNIGKGFNARASKNIITESWFKDNRRGIFLFEGDQGSVITGNRFTGNETPFRLGDFYEGDVSVFWNEWEREPTDYKSDATAATLRTAPSKVGEVGPTGWRYFKKGWEREYKGFVDALSGDELGLYVASWDGTLERLAFLTGEVFASTIVGDITDAAPATGRINGRDYLAINSWDRTLRLYDAKALTLLDTFKYYESPADDHRQSAPLFVDGILHLATWSRKVFALKVDGDKLWPHWSFAGNGPFRAKLTHAANILFAPSESGTLFALDISNGKEIWGYKAGEPLISQAVFDDNTLYVADKGGTLHALTHQEKVKWKKDLGGAAWTSPTLVTDNLLYQGDDSGTLSVFSKSTGEVTRRVQIEGGIRQAPVMVDSILYVATADGYLYALAPDTLMVIDRVKVANHILADLLPFAGRIIVGSRPGAVTSYTLE